MPGIKVKLIASYNARSKDHKGTLNGMGLYKFGQERILPDNASTLGMCQKMRHMVSWEKVAESPVKRPRPQSKQHKLAAEEAAKAQE